MGVQSGWLPLWVGASPPVHTSGNLAVGKADSEIPWPRPLGSVPSCPLLALTSSLRRPVLPRAPLPPLPSVLPRLSHLPPWAPSLLPAFPRPHPPLSASAPRCLPHMQCAQDGRWVAPDPQEEGGTGGAGPGVRMRGGPGRNQKAPRRR